jgi:hypothetical protein
MFSTLTEVMPRHSAAARRQRNRSRSRSLQERADAMQRRTMQLLEDGPMDPITNAIMQLTNDPDANPTDVEPKVRKLLKVRRKILDTLQSAGIDPYANELDPDDLTDDDPDASDELPDADEEEDVDPPQSSCGQTRAMPLPAGPQPPKPRISKVPAAMRNPVEHVIARLAARQRGPGAKAVRRLVENIDTRESLTPGQLSRRPRGAIVNRVASVQSLVEQRDGRASRSAAQLMRCIDTRRK